MTGDAKKSSNPPRQLRILTLGDADPYIPNGYVDRVAQSLFLNSYRSIRNIVIDLRQMPATTSAIRLHWKASQATSLMNIVVEMSTTSGNYYP
ncbi:glycoside hydrolase family 55 protein [Serpula lacrymans var. lacrymans S7.3]|uniref:Glycoside hydrolase family 55 protein n=1 Tax=Serpula lacrymans var. lacrymans (strain S7.3) TaxID=936435 RepID=F8QFF2_SERL3|nr:glycoside hydrolase family 55 protein [Serpula lacrymans var. lacrymans S7.3]